MLLTILHKMYDSESNKENKLEGPPLNLTISRLYGNIQSRSYKLKNKLAANSPKCKIVLNFYECAE